MFKTVNRVLGAAAVGLVFFFGVGAAVAGAQTPAECDIADGLEAYLECVAGGGGGTGTGNDGGTGTGADGFATCGPTTLPAGATSSCSVSGLQAGADISATFESDPVVVYRGKVSDTGNDNFDFAVPSGVELGSHTLTIESTKADGEAATAKIAYTVVSGVTVTGTLARTGSDVGSMVGIGSALVLLGGATVYGVRQRRQFADS